VGGLAGGFRNSDELLRWKALQLQGLSVAVAPGKPAQVDVGHSRLSDFYARLVVNPTGRINLQDLVNSGSDDARSTSDKAAAAAGAGAASAPSAPSAPVAERPPAAGAPVIRFGPIELADGRVLFQDRFVQPNYSADLSELSGSLGAFSSVPAQGSPQLADLRLRGRAEGTAALDIEGADVVMHEYLYCLRERRQARLIAGFLEEAVPGGMLPD
jgi:hypothetical protein